MPRKSCDNAATKRACAPPAPLSTAFQQSQYESAKTLRHARDLPNGYRGMKTPSPEGSYRTAPIRDVSPPVARTTTARRVGQEAKNRSNLQPSRSYPIVDRGSKRLFDLSGMSPLPAIGKQRGTKSWSSLDRALHDDDETTSIESTKTAASAPENCQANQLQRRNQQSKYLGMAPKHWPPDEKRLMTAAKAALAWTTSARSAPIFDFRMNSSAATKNFETLQKAEFNLQSLIMADESSPIRPGSEFRPVHLLEPIFNAHPLWPRMKNSLSCGATLVLEDIPDSDRLTLLDTAISYGNHKSAGLHSELLLPQLQQEVEKGWHLPLPIARLNEIPGLIMGPMGAVAQSSIDETGQVTNKVRMTHDQSFDYALEKVKSVNHRVTEDSLSSCQFGFALRRLIHAIIALRWIFPLEYILVGKFDYKSAFRRLHLNGQAALQSTLSTTGLSNDPVALASLRVTFGGRPSPSLFSEVSESITDLANALVRCKSWDPGELTPTHSNLIGDTKLEPEQIPMAKAREMAVDPKIDKHGLIDVFIDDIITVFPAISPKHSKKCSLAALLALDVTSRPVHPHETVPRDPMLATNKALAEGTPAESQIILGWKIDTRRLLISLPHDKHSAWKRDTNAILTSSAHNKRVKHKELEKLLGRLQHTASILPDASHFLNRIRAAEMRANKHGATRLCIETRRDLAYWLTLLDRAIIGIDMNLLVARLPNFIIRTDACEEGLGGYSLTTGRAWRYRIPQNAKHLKSINYLEFLACITGVMVSLFDGEGSKGDCFLSLGDNTSSLGWLRKSNFTLDDQASHSALARNFATKMAEHGLCHFSQWFPGKENDAADILSRNCVSTDKQLTRHIKFAYSTQVSTDFRISPLPPAISSWVDYWVQHTRDTTESPPAPTENRTSTSGTGSSSLIKAKYSTTPSLTRSVESTSIESSAHSSKRSEKRRTPKVQRKMNAWLQAHAAPPSATYARPSATKADPIHRSTQTEILHSFYEGSSKATPTWIQPAKVKNRSHSTSSRK
jgi:hypothetical protein